MRRRQEEKRGEADALLTIATVARSCRIAVSRTTAYGPSISWTCRRSTGDEDGQKRERTSPYDDAPSSKNRPMQSYTTEWIADVSKTRL